MKDRNNPGSIGFIILCFFIFSCHSNSGPRKENIVSSPEKMDEQTSENIHEFLDYALLNKGKIDDSTQLKFVSLTNIFYQQNNYSSNWSKKEKWAPLADSLLLFLNQAKLYGLFPADYNLKKLEDIKKVLDTDSMQRMNAIRWSTADIVFTDGCIGLLKDLKFGRLIKDNSPEINDSSFKGKWLVNKLQLLMKQSSVSTYLNSIEPSHKGYQQLKGSIKIFLDSMDNHIYTYVPYPFKKNNSKDSLFFIKKVQNRLIESNCIKDTTNLPDSLQLAIAIKKFQKLSAVKQDGNVSASLIRQLNNTDVEKYKRIAITLDRYKLLPDSMPEKFIWVNLPGYYLQVWDHDTIAFTSKIICGKTETRTPLLTSSISDMVTYPTWTVPTSIIAKQYLPKLKLNPNYLTKIGLKVVTEKGVDVDPATIKWSKYKKGIPFKVIQNSGDDNALGVIKFNFNNPFAVYLHDTNQRYLFKNSKRAFSHGCVRVQEWQKLAIFIAENDSINLKPGDQLLYNTDSIFTWIAAKKHQRINVKNELRLFITYYSCEVKDGKIKFYEDIYDDDKELREKYFNDK